jgi:hypothetical protein
MAFIQCEGRGQGTIFPVIVDDLLPAVIDVCFRLTYRQQPLDAVLGYYSVTRPPAP